jgi:hypothetical protein
LREEKQVKYNVSVPFRVQSTIDVSSPRVLVRECGRILEQVGCAKSCSPDSARFVETSGLFPNSFWICPEYCEEFFQYCVDVTEQRFVNAQTFCEQQRLDNGLQVRVRDFSCYSAGRLSAAADQSFAYGRALYGGAANQLATFYVQAVDRFGNYKSRGGDEFIPSLFDSRGTPTPIKIVDNDDGTYTVTFSPKPDTYTIDVTLGGVSIRNVPRKATFSGSAKCVCRRSPACCPSRSPIWRRASSLAATRAATTSFCARGARRSSRSTSTTPARRCASRRSTTCCAAFRARRRSRASCASTTAASAR